MLMLLVLGWLLFALLESVCVRFAGYFFDVVTIILGGVL
jgi:hypothetical protein